MELDKVSKERDKLEEVDFYIFIFIKMSYSTQQKSFFLLACKARRNLDSLEVFIFHKTLGALYLLINCEKRNYQRVTTSTWLSQNQCHYFWTSSKKILKLIIIVDYRPINNSCMFGFFSHITHQRTKSYEQCLYTIKRLCHRGWKQIKMF